MLEYKNTKDLGKLGFCAWLVIYIIYTVFLNYKVSKPSFYQSGYFLNHIVIQCSTYCVFYLDTFQNHT